MDLRPGEDKERPPSEPKVMSGRGLWRSSQRPTGKAATADMAKAVEKAPVSSVFDQPSSRCIGARKTAKA